MASQLGVLTDNEVRALLGYEAITNGDTIYKPSNQIAVGQDAYIEDNRNEPAKKEFIRIMQKQLKHDGSKFYTDEYIQLKAKEFYGN